MVGEPPPQIDTSKPSVARIYDAGLGGKDNYEVDREVLRALLEIEPEAMLAARDNRRWLSRISRFLAGKVGISQFLDLGSGLPTAENTHQVVQEHNPDAFVVYVDNDPIVQAHGRALLAGDERTRFMAADLTRPHELLNDPMLQRFLDFSEPIALYQIGTLHHLPEPGEIREIMRAYADALAPGSFIAISHFYNPGGEDGRIAEQLERSMVDGPMGSGYFRTYDEILSFFPPDVELLEPGLVLPPDWWPEGPRTEPLKSSQRVFIAGLGRKP